MFIDQARIYVKAGDGGNGCSSLYRDKYTRHGVPNGGDGGRGSDVIIKADRNLRTLLDFQYNRHFRGLHGVHGSSNNKKGKDADSIIIRVPVGTIVKDFNTGCVLRDLDKDEEQIIVVYGGKGGIGNKHHPRRLGKWSSDLFSHSQTHESEDNGLVSHQAEVSGSASHSRSHDGDSKILLPQGHGSASHSRSQSWKELTLEQSSQLLLGQAGEEKELFLDLKLIAEAGVVGFPNVGKSTLISNISNAHPKIANYPFTTKAPVLGVVNLGDRTFIIADIPGLIEGSSKGKGLGDKFLRHIERTKIIVHLIDMSGSEGRDPVEDYKIINEELESYGKEVCKKSQIIVANKMDIEGAELNLKRFRKNIKKKIYPISALKKEGLEELIEAVAKKL